MSSMMFKIYTVGLVKQLKKKTMDKDATVKVNRLKCKEGSVAVRKNIRNRE